MVYRMNNNSFKVNIWPMKIKTGIRMDSEKAENPTTQNMKV